jgi:hypothetical protein
MFRPPSLLASQIVPTAASFLAGQPRLFTSEQNVRRYLRTHRTYYPPDYRQLAERGLSPRKIRSLVGCSRMMPTFPLPSLKFRTAGFPPYGFKAGRSDRAFPFDDSLRRTVCHCPSCSPLPSSDPRSVPRDVARWSTSVRAAAAALPQGPSLQIGLFCPAPSSLAAPSAPLAGTSRFHRSAAYTKCLRCAHCA